MLINYLSGCHEKHFDVSKRKKNSVWESVSAKLVTGQRKNSGGVSFNQTNGFKILDFSATVAHQFKGTVDKVRTKVRTRFVTNFGRKLQDVEWSHKLQLLQCQLEEELCG